MQKQISLDTPSIKHWYPQLDIFHDSRYNSKDRKYTSSLDEDVSYN